MNNKEIAHYVNNGARLEMANLLGYNKNGFQAIAISGADIGWDFHADGSVTLVLFLDRKHIFHKQSKNAPLEYVCSR